MLGFFNDCKLLCQDLSENHCLLESLLTLNKDLHYYYAVTKEAKVSLTCAGGFVTQYLSRSSYFTST